MVRNYWKLLKNKHFSWFSVFHTNDEKRCQRGPQKPWFWVENGDMGLPESTYPLIFDALLRCQTIFIFGRPADRPKNRAVERQRVEKVPQGFRRRQVSGRLGSPRTNWKYDPLTIGPSRRDPDTPSGRRSGEFFYITIHVHMFQNVVFQQMICYYIA